MRAHILAPKWIETKEEDVYDNQSMLCFLLQSTIMGKGKRWIKAESVALAEAFIASREDGSATIEGTNQTADYLWETKVMPQFLMRALGVCDPDWFHNRGLPAIKAHWQDRISKDVQKFNRALLIIYNSHPTGCTEQEKINMAVALHLGKADGMDYNFKVL
jgi:hypothetical protein